jgi:hypothetical protein
MVFDASLINRPPSHTVANLRDDRSRPREVVGREIPIIVADRSILAEQRGAQLGQREISNTLRSSPIQNFETFLE